MCADEGTQRFPLIVLLCPATQHEEDVVAEEAHVSLHPLWVVDDL